MMSKKCGYCKANIPPTKYLGDAYCNPICKGKEAKEWYDNMMSETLEEKDFYWAVKEYLHGEYEIINLFKKGIKAEQFIKDTERDTIENGETLEELEESGEYLLEGPEKLYIKYHPR